MLPVAWRRQLASGRGRLACARAMCFNVRFPVETGRSTGGGMERPKRRLLVIEDDRDFIETLELVLPPHGYELRHANDAASVAAALEDFPAAVALVDVRLRSGSGLD